MSRGGFRPGAGRKVNSGMFVEKTVVRGVPVSIAAVFNTYLHTLKSGKEVSFGNVFYHEDSSVTLPLFSNTVPAGFPSPAESDVESYLDLNKYLIPNPATSFFVKVSGDSMILAGINDGDILIVDRSLEARNGRYTWVLPPLVG